LINGRDNERAGLGVGSTIAPQLTLMGIFGNATVQCRIVRCGEDDIRAHQMSFFIAFPHQGDETFPSLRLKPRAELPGDKANTGAMPKQHSHLALSHRPTANHKAYPPLQRDKHRVVKGAGGLCAIVSHKIPVYLGLHLYEPRCAGIAGSFSNRISPARRLQHTPCKIGINQLSFLVAKLGSNLTWMCR